MTNLFNTRADWLKWQLPEQCSGHSVSNKCAVQVMLGGTVTGLEPIQFRLPKKIKVQLITAPCYRGLSGYPWALPVITANRKTRVSDMMGERMSKCTLISAVLNSEPEGYWSWSNGTWTEETGQRGWVWVLQEEHYVWVAGMAAVSAEHVKPPSCILGMIRMVNSVCVLL